MLLRVKIEAVRVYHRKEPFGYVLTTADGFKMVFSGDTRPSTNLIPAGQLLIEIVNIYCTIIQIMNLIKNIGLMLCVKVKVAIC